MNKVLLFVWQHQCFPDIMNTMQHIHSLNFFDRWRPQFIMHFGSIITVLITIGTSSSVLWHSWIISSSVIAALGLTSASEFFLAVCDLEELGKTNLTCWHCRYILCFTFIEKNCGRFVSVHDATIYSLTDALSLATTINQVELCFFHLLDQLSEAWNFLFPSLWHS